MNIVATPVVRRALGLLFLLLFAPSLQADSTYEQQRDLFRQAESALKEGNRLAFWQLLDELRTYPLYPYLRYDDLLQRLDSARREEVERYLEAYADTPLASRMQYAWLEVIAKRGDWNTYLEVYQPSVSKHLQCHYRHALIRTGQSRQAMADIEQLWLHGHSLPASCDPVLDFWRAEGGLSNELVWQRIRLALEAGQPSLARYLARFLTDTDRKWVDVWLRLRKRPSLLLEPDSLAGKHRVIAWIVPDVMARLAGSDPEKAAAAWERIEQRFQLREEQRATLTRRIALALAYRGHQQAGIWLARIAQSHVDDTVREWRVRSALTNEDWPRVLGRLDELSDSHQLQGRWRYWRARALAAQSRDTEARAIYEQLAKTRSYEGFLAADILGQPYEFLHETLVFSTAELDELARVPGVLRARELLYVGREVDARREWYAVTKEMEDSQLRRVAKLAQTWGWHDQAILTLARSSYQDDLELRFPVLHKESVLQQAEQANVDPAWAFAVIRKESAFNSEARSHRGALGLMQLLPATARQIARELNTRISASNELYDADVNIRLGVNYLRKVLDKFSEHPVLATAAYNAGHYRVRNWLPQKSLPADIWIETVPYGETRNYLRSVLAFTAIYEQRIGLQPTPLHLRMPPVGPVSGE